MTAAAVLLLVFGGLTTALFLFLLASLYGIYPKELRFLPSDRQDLEDFQYQNLVVVKTDWASVYGVLAEVSK